MAPPARASLVLTRTITGTGIGDRFLATWLHNSCVNVVALARMAEARTECEAVLEFARDAASLQHGIAIKLQLHTRLVEDHVEVPAPQRPDVPRGMAFDVLTMLDELGNQHLQSQTATLSGKRGPDFDRTYLAMQILLLRNAVDLAEVAQRFASEPLRRSLVDIAVVIAGHRERATTLERQTAEAAAHSAPQVGGKAR